MESLGEVEGGLRHREGDGGQDAVLTAGAARGATPAERSLAPVFAWTQLSKRVEQHCVRWCH